MSRKLWIKISRYANRQLACKIARLGGRDTLLWRVTSSMPRVRLFFPHVLSLETARSLPIPSLTHYIDLIIHFIFLLFGTSVKTCTHVTIPLSCRNYVRQAAISFLQCSKRALHGCLCTTRCGDLRWRGGCVSC